MLKVGITGGIGAGKTTVCNIFAKLNIPIYDADARAKYLINHSLFNQIAENFGNDVYKDGVLQNDILAQKAFASKTKTELLNSIVHPAVAKDYEDWQTQQASLYSIKEAALLIEAGSYKALDKLIVVTAPEEIRIERVMKRNKMSREHVLERMNKQMPEAEKVTFADFIINNDGNSSLIEQVLAIHKELIEASQINDEDK